VVDHIRVLPHIERENDGEARQLPELVVSDEDGVERIADLVVIDDNPADAARGRNLADMFDELLATPIFLFGSLGE